MFGRKNKNSLPDPTGADLYDFELRRTLGLGGLSPPNSPIRAGDPGVPPLPETVSGASLSEEQDSVKKLLCQLKLTNFIIKVT